MRSVELPEAWRGRAVVLADVDSDGWLTAEELAEAGTFTLEKRQHEWMASRAAAKRFAMDLGVASSSASIRVSRPRLLIDGSAGPFVSLSHSAPYVGVAIASAPVGIDVQVVRTIKPRAAHLFLQPQEEDAAAALPVPNALLHFWCAKEAAWKRESPRYETLRQLPLRVLDVTARGVRFDAVETVLAGDVVVALTR